jgi:hypothetical protein
VDRLFSFMARKVKLSTLKNKLDKIFSEYIRRRDVDDHTGFGKCIDCGRETPFAEGDAGHFVGRRHLSTRWDEDNVHFQHRYCNRFLNGRQYEYGQALGDKADELIQKSHQVAKFDATHLQYLIDIYKDKLAELKKNQSF